MFNFEAFNQWLFMRINAGIETPSWIVETAILIADDLIYLIPVLLVALWLWGDHERRGQAIMACLVTLLALGANQVIGMVWQHPRPFMIGLGHAWMPHAADSSFPSDHITVFAGVGLTLLFGGAIGISTAILGAGVAVAWARVMLGVHFPLDMVGAVVTASVSLVIISPVWRLKGTSLTNLAEKAYRTVFAYPITQGWVQR